MAGRFVLCVLVVTGCGRIAFAPIGDRDGSPGTGDAPDLQGANAVFTSSENWLPSQLGGVGGADDRCTMLANEAGLPGRYVAWLSSTTSNAIDRLQGARGWKRVDGLPVADRVEDIASGLRHAINLDEHGANITIPGSVITATDTTGRLLIDDGVNFGTCVDYTGGGFSQLYAGDEQITGAGFTAGEFQDCSTNGHLYCFGIESKAPLVWTPATGRIAFITAADWSPGAGIASADALCQSEADAAGLVGTFRALLAGVGVQSQSRFDSTGTPWVRVDGGLLAATAAELFGGARSTSLGLTANGTSRIGPVWTGGYPSNVGTSGTTCSGWMNSGGGMDARVGDARYASARMFDSSTAPCSSSLPLYCLQI